MIDELEITHHFGGGVYAKAARINPGLQLTQHVHKYDHLSILASGTADVTVDGVTTRHTGPTCLTIAAGKAHEVASITPVVWYCIHATNETDPGKVDEGLIS